MKLVVDVNVLVSGSLWTGNPSRLVDALLDGSATLCTSRLIMEEFEEVLQRDKFQKRLVQNGLSAQEIVSRFQAAAMIVESPSIPVPPTLRDSDDIHVLACARSACANAIVTGDSDLLSMKAFEGIPILSVRQLLEKLGISAV